MLGGLSLRGVWWAFTSTEGANWHPVTWLSHMLDVELFGPNPGMHHAISLVLHVVNALLLFGLLHRMTGALGRSAFVAAVFAVHPLHVESVVAYVAFVERPSRRRYAWIIGAFALGLIAKPMILKPDYIDARNNLTRAGARLR